MGRGQELLDAAREGDRRTVEKIIGQIVTKRSGPFPSLRRGPGVNVQDDNGYTPLHHACLNGHKEIVKLLLSTSCDVPASPCIVDKKGATPLHLAAFKGQTEVVKMLLDYDNPRVNIDQMTTNRETALLIAAHFGYVDIVALLIARGADVTIRNANMESALDLAAQFGWLDTVKHLVRVRPQLVDPYRLPPLGDSRYLSGGDTTPLHRAAKHGKEDVVEALIDAGFDPNIRTDNGTALHEAACFARADVVRLLLRRGGNLNARDCRGRTVYDMLKDHPKEATRKVREAIREFDRCPKSSYESEEDLPRFPVDHDYSPTAPAFNYIKASSSISQKKQAYLDSIRMNDEKVTNANNSIPSPITKPKKLYKDTHLSVTPNHIMRTDSFLSKEESVKKLMKGRGPEMSHFAKQFELVSELQTLHSSIIKPKEISNQRPKESMNPKKIERSNVFKSIKSIWPQLDQPDPRPFRLDSIDKKKPAPAPKPKTYLENDHDKIAMSKFHNSQLTNSHASVCPQKNYESYEYESDQLYANTRDFKDDCQIYENTNDLIVNEQIYENLSNLNISDDVKANIPIVESENTYTSMKPATNAPHIEKPTYKMCNGVSSTVEQNYETYTRMTPTVEQHYDTYTRITPTVEQNYDTYTRMTPTVEQNYDTYTRMTPAVNTNNEIYMPMTPTGNTNNEVYMPMTPTRNTNNEIYMPMTPIGNADTDIYTHITTPDADHDLYADANILNRNIDCLSKLVDSENHYLSVRKDPIYLPMKPKLYRRLSTGDFPRRTRTFSASSDYVDMDVNVRCKVSPYAYTRVMSIPEGFPFAHKPYSMHIRGVSGCLFEEDDSYIYEINHNALRNNEYPFTKKKQNKFNMPCYCKDLSKYKNCEKLQSQNVYYSCEVGPEKEESQYTYVEDSKNPSKTFKIKGPVENNIVVKRLNNSESPSEDLSADQQDSSEIRQNVFRKKIIQLKQLVTEW